MSAKYPLIMLVIVGIIFTLGQGAGNIIAQENQTAVDQTLDSLPVIAENNNTMTALSNSSNSTTLDDESSGEEEEGEEGEEEGNEN